MIEIRLVINDMGDSVNIRVVSGPILLVEDQFKKRKNMDLKAFVRQRARNNFDHALEIVVDDLHWEVNEP